MNTIQSYFTASPFNLTEECAMLMLDELEYPYILPGIMVVSQEYTLSFWVKADAKSTITVCNTQIPVTTSWAKHVITFTASEQDISFVFGATGAYYIYCPKLERGNKATDWTPAPEDAQGVADEANELAKTANEAKARLEAL